MTIQRNFTISMLALLPAFAMSCSSEPDTSNGTNGGSAGVSGSSKPTSGSSTSAGRPATVSPTGSGGGSSGGGAPSVITSGTQSKAGTASGAGAPSAGAATSGSAGRRTPGGAGTKADGGAAATSGTVATTGRTATSGRATSGRTGEGGAKTDGGAGATSGTVPTSGTVAAGGATGDSGGTSCPLPTTFSWKDNGGPIANPGTGWVSIKDFTNVVYNGQHIIYMSTHDNGTTYGSAAMAPFTEWSGAATATQTKMGTSTVAPELMYFTPKSTWILSYQWCSAKFCYMTSSDPTKASSWTGSKALFNGTISNSDTGPIDQVVICDSKNCYLFFAGDNGSIYRSSMAIGSFPGTFGNATTIMTDTKNNLFEAVEVYTIKGTGKYLMIVEAMGSGGRFFRAFTATSLDGSWTAMPSASSEATPFAGKRNVEFGTSWTNDISHGDLVRSHDETRTIDPCNLQMIYQGYDPSFNGAYDLKPYRLGLLTLKK